MIKIYLEKNLEEWYNKPYLHLLVPVFLDKKCFEQNVKEILKHPFDDLLPIYSAVLISLLLPLAEKLLEY